MQKNTELFYSCQVSAKKSQIFFLKAYDTYNPFFGLQKNIDEY